jgi:hypothetical protein
MLPLGDPDLFLRDHGETVVWGSTTGLGILDMPGKVIAGGAAISNDYELNCRTDLFGGVKKGDSITHDGVAYKAREAPLPIDDGVFCHIYMSKV